MHLRYVMFVRAPLCIPSLRRVPLPESLLLDDSASESDAEDDHVERRRVSAGGSFRHSEGTKCGGNSDIGRSRASSVDDDGDGDGSTSAGRSSTTGPRVVDRLRRTRAAAAAIGNQ